MLKFQTKLQETKPRFDGTLIAIDPALGTTHSMPGFAVWIAGEFHDAGTLCIDPKASLATRLGQIYQESYTLKQQYTPSVVVIENIPISMGFKSRAHKNFLMAVGTTIAAFGTDGCPVIEVPIYAWQSWVKQATEIDYVKSDTADAYCIGACCLSILRGEFTPNATKTKRSRVRRSYTRTSTKQKATRSPKACRTSSPRNPSGVRFGRRPR